MPEKDKKERKRKAFEAFINREGFDILSPSPEAPQGKEALDKAELEGALTKQRGRKKN